MEWRALNLEFWDVSSVCVCVCVSFLFWLFADDDVRACISILRNYYPVNNNCEIIIMWSGE